MQTARRAALTMVLALTAQAAAAATILSTDFTGRTVTGGGTTATTIPWLFDGVSDPGDLFSEFPIINTADGQNLFAVDRNLNVVRGGGPWAVDIPLNVLGDPLALETLSFDVRAFDFQLNFAGVNREIDVGYTFLDDTDAVLGAGFRDNVNGLDNGLTSGPWHVDFDVSAVTLAANEAYSLRLAFSQNGNQIALSNRAGFDNLQLTGAPPANVPLPAGLPFVLTGIGAFALIRRRRPA